MASRIDLLGVGNTGDLEHYFADFAPKHDEEKLVDIVRKTWRKMSPRGHEAARGLRFPPELGVIVTRALNDV